MFCIRCFESTELPESNDNRGSGGGCKVGSLILPFAQHIPGISLFNFRALQSPHLIHFADVYTCMLTVVV